MQHAPGQRQCPICAGQPLNEVHFEGQEVDLCERCHGIYFDKGELSAVVGLVGIFRSIELPEPEIDCVPVAEREREVLCPADGAPMEPREVAFLYLDFCPTCGGVWADGGEVTALKLAENQIRRNLTLYVRLGS